MRRISGGSRNIGNIFRVLQERFGWILVGLVLPPAMRDVMVVLEKFGPWLSNEGEEDLLKMMRVDE